MEQWQVYYFTALAIGIAFYFKKFLNKKQNLIMAKQTELAAQLTSLSTQVSKIGTETAGLQTKIADLQAAIDNLDEVTPELQAAADALKTQIQTVDDLVADAPVVEPPVEPTPPTEGTDTGAVNP